MPTALWNIVLAAGAGRRLASVTGGVPKQFWSVDGGRSLLDTTLERTAPLAPAARTLVVVDRTHEPFVRRLAESGAGRLLFQPRDRGTAAGVLLALAEVVAARPEATVLLTPSDHGIVGDRHFLSGIRRAVRHVRAGRERIVLFGVSPSAPEGDYGWITPAKAAPVSGAPFRRVASFVEKPARQVAEDLLARDAVWNTMVLVARASALVDAYRRHLPAMTDCLLPPDAQAGTDPTAIHDRYERLTPADFSRDLLEKSEDLALHTWPVSMGWTDLGTPDRLARWIARRRGYARSVIRSRHEQSPRHAAALHAARG